MDCLDRTNVVESILSREVLQTAVSMKRGGRDSNSQQKLSLQLQKLGMIPFDEKLGGSTLTSYQEMWANNGDIISKQYAGTAAMKVCLPAMPLSSPNLIVIAGGHYSLWGEKALGDDEGRLQLCPQILPQRI